ncbi:unnamed protein product, partial [Amoebophrya sp. A25]|eukprot:GSA25T00028067001.1
MSSRIFFATLSPSNGFATLSLSCCAVRCDAAPALPIPLKLNQCESSRKLTTTTAQDPPCPQYVTHLDNGASVDFFCHISKWC